jgi:glucosamine 6-phosphate synthetase-like amidotransferase/phosphosugar isomerase protein
MPADSFNATVAARTRCARQIRDTPDLLARFEAAGGLSSDLDAIVEAGDHAEAGALGQSQAKGSQQAATLEVHKGFAQVQHEYVAVMSVVQAVVSELARTGGTPETVAALKQVLVNEAAVVVTTTASGAKKARKAQSHEATRAEIERDASALLALSDAAAALAARKVDAARLTQLRDAARGLSGKVADGAAKKGSAKAATQLTHQAVAEQRAAWQGALRLLQLVAAGDARVQALLKGAQK